MIERFENAVQMAVLLLCALIAASRAIRQKNKEWTLLALFFCSYFLGDLYWLLCLVFYGQTPRISVVSDMNWYASYLFLYLLLRQAAPPDSAREKRLLPWLGFVFSMAMAVFYFGFSIDWSARHGENQLLIGTALNNLICGMLMGLLLFSCIRRLMDGRRYPRFLCAAIMFFCLVEYGLWTSSCFWWSQTLDNPYYWFDLTVTAGALLLVPATEKAVAE